MTGRERIEATCNHEEPDRVAVDFGGGFQTGMHVSTVYQLRQYYGLDAPGTPVKVVEPYQMLGEIEDDLKDALGIDTVSLAGSGTMFGFPSADFKEWIFDGIPVLVPGGFNTDYEPNGDLFQYPGDDRAFGPCAKLPDGGCFLMRLIASQKLMKTV